MMYEVYDLRYEKLNMATGGNGRQRETTGGNGTQRETTGDNGRQQETTRCDQNVGPGLGTQGFLTSGGRQRETMDNTHRMAK